ncbi:unnamed protein product [Allacma fusca]|uniref:Uncharacterized protein n=1 Tax=Allacma fusca TaxID=39272 RepID=A0A8J2LDI7_9HEXA|nr:unnamed protein product [Allacma fusca]
MKSFPPVEFAIASQSPDSSNTIIQRFTSRTHELTIILLLLEFIVTLLPVSEGLLLYGATGLDLQNMSVFID